MKILVINTDQEEQRTGSFLRKIISLLKERGIGSEYLWCGKEKVRGCVGCGKCLKRGRCIIPDQVNEVIERADEYDGLIAGCTVFYGETDPQYAAFMERLFRCAADRFVCHPAAAVVTHRGAKPGNAPEYASGLFADAGMFSVMTQDHNAFRIGEPEGDTLKKAAVLADSLQYLLLCISAAKEAGIDLPRIKAEKRMDFLR